MHLLIDADSLIYKAACPCETLEYVLSIDGERVMLFQYKSELEAFAADMPPEWGDFEWWQELTALEPVENALFALNLKLNSIIEESGCDSYSLHLTKGENFRHRIATIRPYKGTRTSKPAHHKACFEYLESDWGATYTYGLEADDVVSMSLSGDPEMVVAHIDKDIDTVAGKHYNFDTYEFYFVTQQEALVNFYRQMLVGDTSDNIAGVDGIGKVGAAKMIHTNLNDLEMFSVICSAFDNDVDRVLETGRLLHMTRELHEDGTPVLWEFP